MNGMVNRVAQTESVIKNAEDHSWCTYSSFLMGWHLHTPNNQFRIEGDIDIPSFSVHTMHIASTFSWAQLLMQYLWLTWEC